MNLWAIGKNDRSEIREKQKQKQMKINTTKIRNNVYTYTKAMRKHLRKTGEKSSLQSMSVTLRKRGQTEPRSVLTDPSKSRAEL